MLAQIAQEKGGLEQRAAGSLRRASQAIGLSPDLVSVGKALGGGVPIGACLCSERIAQAVSPGDHGTTYGGNLLACRAAVFFLEQLMDKGLLEHVNAVSPHFERGLRTIALRHPLVVAEVCRQ